MANWKRKICTKTSWGLANLMSLRLTKQTVFEEYCCCCSSLEHEQDYSVARGPDREQKKFSAKLVLKTKLLLARQALEKQGPKENVFLG
jgi:hypothetical protein